jgi:hypothetical protein
VNIFTGRIYECRIDFLNAIKLAGAKFPDFLAFCAAKSLSGATFGALLAEIEKLGDPMTAARTIHEFVQFFGPFLTSEFADSGDLAKAVRSTVIGETLFGQLDQMAEDFPSAGEVSRNDFYWRLLKRKMAAKPERQLEKTALRVMEQQLMQNAAVAAIDEGVKLWLKSHIVEESWQNLVEYIVAKELELYSLPGIVGMKGSAAIVAKIGRMELKRQLTEFYRVAKNVLETNMATIRPAGIRPILSSSLPDRLDLDELASLQSELTYV